jgi:adenylate cyclase
MNLRQKTLLLTGLSLASLIAVLSVSLSTILLGSFDQLEQQNARQNVHRVEKALREEIEALNRTSNDWSSWDDTYKFAENGNKDFIQKNLDNTVFANLKLNLFLIINRQGKLIHSRSFDLEKNAETPFPESLLPHLNPKGFLLTHPNPKSEIRGILMLREGILMVADQPILTSEDRGPIRGTLIMGRYLNLERIQALEERTESHLMLYPLNDPFPSPQLLEIQLALTEMETSDRTGSIPILARPIDAKVFAGYTLLRDIYGKPALLLRVDLPREIHQQGQIALVSLILSLLAVGVTFGAIAGWLLEKMVLSRLAKLSADVREIGTSNNLALRVRARGNDELTRLAQTINWMLEQLAASTSELVQEREKSERLLLNILPAPIAQQLKQNQHPIAEQFNEVTILFADIVGFTPLSARLSPIELVNLLNQIFSEFDRLAENFGLEKIKTIGDAYMVAAGLPLPRPDHADAIARMALQMQKTIERFQLDLGEKFQIRIGVHTGTVVAGVIGTQKFIYDLWGDTVNTASRMESHGLPGKIQMTEETYQRLKHQYIFEKRGEVFIKGKGLMTVYWLVTCRKQPKLTPIA